MGKGMGLECRRRLHVRVQGNGRLVEFLELRSLWRGGENGGSEILSELIGAEVLGAEDA